MCPKLLLLLFAFLVSHLVLFSCMPEATEHSGSEKSGNEKLMTHSEIVTGQEAKEINETLHPYPNQLTFLDSFSIDYQYTRKEENDYMVEISFIKHADSIKTKIEKIGYIYDPSIQIDIHNNIGYICWVSKPNYPNSNNDDFSKMRYDLHFISIDLKTGKEYFNQIIYSKKFSIDRLSMKYNPFTNSILIAYNDFSLSNDHYLMYGAIKLVNNIRLETELSPKEILSQDGSEKRYPQFLIDSKNVYLYNSTGDDWGFFAHTGKSQIGISRINSENKPIDYKVLIDSCEIIDEENLVLIRDTIFYTTRCPVKNKPDEFLTKKASMQDLADF